MNYHVIADTKGEVIAWVKATPATNNGPRVVIQPLDPKHVLHENLEINAPEPDRENLIKVLRKAVVDRIRHRR